MHPEIDRFSHLQSPFHSWDPRIKLASMLVLLVSMATANSIWLSGYCLLSSIALLLLARIPLAFVAARLKEVTFFLLVFALILSLFGRGQVLVNIFGVAIYEDGTYLGVRLFLRGIALILLIFPIFGTTKFDITMRALQDLRVSPKLVTVILFTYRYIFVFMDQVQRLNLAMQVRGFRKKTDIATLRSIGFMVGALLVDSFERTERIYQAMLLRGFSGVLTPYHRYTLCWQDWLKGVLVVGLASAIIFLRL